ncbi:MAG: hypothetical protein ACOYD7_09010 [Raoultibacter sp.]|jgi:hypothetical protein
MQVYKPLNQTQKLTFAVAGLIILTAVILCCCMPKEMAHAEPALETSGDYATTQAQVVVDNFDDLKTEIENVTPGNSLEVTISSFYDSKWADTITVPQGAQVTIKGETSTVALKRMVDDFEFWSNMFTVSEGS